MLSNQPSRDEIFAYLLGEADKETVRRIEAARKESPEFASRLRHGTEMMRDLTDWASVAALFEVDREVVDHISRTTAPRPGVADRVRDFAVRTAALVANRFTSGMQPVPGFRGAAPGRHLVFEVDDVRIEMHITPKRPAIPGVSAGEIGVTGAILGSINAVSIQMIDPDRTKTRYEIDEDGFFVFSTSPGMYRIDVETETEFIRIPQVELSADAP